MIWASPVVALPSGRVFNACLTTVGSGTAGAVLALEAARLARKRSRPVALEVAVTNEPTPAKPMSPTPRLTRAVPVIFVVNVRASAEFFRDTLGFSIDFLEADWLNRRADPECRPRDYRRRKTDGLSA